MDRRKSWEEVEPTFLRLMKAKPDGQGSDWSTGEFLDTISDMIFMDPDLDDTPDEDETITLIGALCNSYSAMWR